MNSAKRKILVSINSMIIYLNFCVLKVNDLIQMHNLINLIIENNRKIGLEQRIEISARFSVNFQFWAEVKKVTSRAEQKILQLGSGSSLLSALDFWHSLAWNFEFDELDFFYTLNWIFAAWVACKNSVQTRNLIFQTRTSQKSSAYR